MASHREARVLAGKPGSYMKVGPLDGRQGLSLVDRASHREAGPLTGRPGLSQGGQGSHKESWPLTGRSGLSMCAIVKWSGRTIILP